MTDHAGTPDQENKKKAFDLADGWTKMLSSLSAGTLALSGTFITGIEHSDGSLDGKGVLYVAWFLLILSILFGFFVIGGLIYELSERSTPDVQAETPRHAGMAQFSTFLAGMFLFAIFASVNL